MKHSFQDITKIKAEQRQIKINNIKKELSELVKRFDFHKNNNIRHNHINKNNKMSK